MKPKRIALAVAGLAVLYMLSFLLSKPTHASTPSSPVPVQVVNKPTVTVGNTLNVQVANTPNVNVANPLTITTLPAVVSYADLYPVQFGDSCFFPAGSTQCTVADIYTVPDGFYAVLTDFNGFCFTYPVPLGTAQLLVQWEVYPETINAPIQQAPVSNALINPGTFGFSGAKYKASAGTSITAQVTVGSSTPTGANCSYLVTGYLVPSTASEPAASLPSGTVRGPRRR